MILCWEIKLFKAEQSQGVKAWKFPCTYYLLFLRQELLKSLTSSSDETSQAMTLLQPRPESTPPGWQSLRCKQFSWKTLSVMQQHRPLLVMSVSTSNMLEESPPMSAFTSNMMEDSTQTSNVLEHPASTSSLLDPSSTPDLLEPTSISNSGHHSSSSYLGSSCSSSSEMTGSPPTGSPPSSAALAPPSSSNSPSFPVYVHTEGARDGIVALPGEEGDEEQELVEYYEQVWSKTWQIPKFMSHIYLTKSG